MSGVQGTQRASSAAALAQRSCDRDVRWSALLGGILRTLRNNLVKLTDWLYVGETRNFRHDFLHSWIGKRCSKFFAGLDPEARNAYAMGSGSTWGNQSPANFELDAVVTEDLGIHRCQRARVVFKVERASLFVWIENRCAVHRTRSFMTG